MSFQKSMVEELEHGPEDGLDNLINGAGTTLGRVGVDVVIGVGVMVVTGLLVIIIGGDVGVLSFNGVGGEGLVLPLPSPPPRPQFPVSQ